MSEWLTLTAFSAHVTKSCISFRHGMSSNELTFQQDITAVISERHGAAAQRNECVLHVCVREDGLAYLK